MDKTIFIDSLLVGDKKNLTFDNNDINIEVSTIDDNYRLRLNPCIKEKNDVILKRFTIKFCNKTDYNKYSYSFPGQDFCLSNLDGKYSIPYGSRFPLSYMTGIYGDKGITVISVNGSRKSFELEKEDGRLSLSFSYLENSDFIPEFIVKIHSADWRDGFDAYRQYYISNFFEIKENYFSGCFHLKRYAFHSKHLPNNVYNNGRFILEQEINKDVFELGGIDIIQLFDWAYTKKDGRTGSYTPWSYLKNIEELNMQLANLQGNGIKIFAYIDAYFSQKNTKLAEAFGITETIKNQNNEPYYQLGEDHWVVCPFIKRWRDFLVEACYSATTNMKVDGIYLDQLGYGNQYICCDATHGHEIPSSQILGEYELISNIKERIRLPLMIEYFPADKLIGLSDAFLTDNDNYLIISRFAIPDKKQFKVINCDEPIGDNVLAVNKAFFNGVGLWLDGDSASNIWYSKNVKQTIRKHYSIMKEFSRCFESMNVIPLIDVLSDTILVNMFITDEVILWTMINPSTTKFFGPLISLKGFNVSDYNFFDVYNNKDVDCVEINSCNYIKCNLDSYCVGCVIAIKKTVN